MFLVCVYVCVCVCVCVAVGLGGGGGVVFFSDLEGILPSFSFYKQPDRKP